MSNLGKWKSGHAGKTAPQCYGDDQTYRIGAAWLEGLAIEDWGCGAGGMRLFFQGAYRGIDGSEGPFVDTVVDLVEYQSRTDGLFMRHVLEHDFEWRRILRNALASFQKRMVLVIFTPFTEKTRQIAWNVGYGDGVPDLSFRREDLLGEIGPYLVREEFHATGTQYHSETVFLLAKDGG